MSLWPGKSLPAAGPLAARNDAEYLRGGLCCSNANDPRILKRGRGRSHRSDVAAQFRSRAARACETSYENRRVGLTLLLLVAQTTTWQAGIGTGEANGKRSPASKPVIRSVLLIGIDLVAVVESEPGSRRRVEWWRAGALQ